MEFFQFACSGFWTFAGTLTLSSLLLYFLVNGAVQTVSRLFRMITVALRGWPPPHLDADGGWNPDPGDNDDGKVASQGRPARGEAGVQEAIGGRGQVPLSVRGHRVRGRSPKGPVRGVHGLLGGVREVEPRCETKGLP